MCLHLTEREEKVIIKLREKQKSIRFGEVRLNIHEHQLSENVRIVDKEKL